MKLIQIVTDGEVAETITMEQCLDRFGKLPPGAQQRLRGTSPKVELDKLREKRKTQKAARKKNR